MVNWPFEGANFFFILLFFLDNLKVSSLSTSIGETFQLTRIPDNEVDGLLYI